MIEEIDDSIFDTFHKDLWKSRGEKLVKCEKIYLIHLLMKLDLQNKSY